MRDSQAIWKPSPNYWPDRKGYTPRYIILHGTAGSMPGCLSWLDNPASQVSAHYLITQDGSIYQLVDEDAAAWANGVLTEGHDSFWSEGINPNLLTISIEHEKPDDQNASQLTTAQINASFALISRICLRWQIPTRRADKSGGITGHYSIDPANRAHCPGPYPWDQLFAYLTQAYGGDLQMLSLGDPMGQFFTDKGNGRWLCKTTGVDLSYGHLDFYRKHEGIFGLPLTNELYLASLPGTAIVCYERAIAIYDPAHKYDNPPGSGSVYLLHLDKGVGQQIVAKPLTIELQNQINTLQTQLAQAKQQTIPAVNVEQINNQLAAYKTALHQVYQVSSQYEEKAA